MAEKKVYIGSVGPLLFDDTDTVDDPDGDFSGYTNKALLTDGDMEISGTYTAGAFALFDIDQSNALEFIWDEDDSDDRICHIEVGGADRNLIIDEDIVASNIVNQADVDDTPVDGETTAPVSSNWAYDHANAVDPHSIISSIVCNNNEVICSNDEVVTV